MPKNKRIEVRLKNTWPISIFRKTSPKIDNREKKNGTKNAILTMKIGIR